MEIGVSMGLVNIRYTSVGKLGLLPLKTHQWVRHQFQKFAHLMAGVQPIRDIPLSISQNLYEFFQSNLQKKGGDCSEKTEEAGPGSGGRGKSEIFPALQICSDKQYNKKLVSRHHKSLKSPWIVSGALSS